MPTIGHGSLNSPDSTPEAAFFNTIVMEPMDTHNQSLSAIWEGKQAEVIG